MDTFENHIKRKQILKSFPQINEKDPYYNHLTVKVSSLSEFVAVISELTRKSKGTEYENLIYRGHSDSSSNYKLVPSLARYNDSLEQSENVIVREVMTLRPDEFHNIKSNFDLLAKMQHYGLPTRILDFSYNPLIALFFACCEGKKAGRVLCTYDTSSLNSDQIIEKICGMYQYNDYNAIFLDRMLGDVSLIRSYALYTRTPLIKKPHYSNDRVKNQAAAFMVFPNVVYDYRSRMVELSKKNNTSEEEYRIGFSLDEQENYRLQYIREESGIYNGNFEVTSNTLKNLIDYYKKKYNDFDLIMDFAINPKYHFLFKDRFSMLNEIQELSEDIISNSFVSIIIDQKQKKRIMSELEVIGIDKAFVYPELMSTTEKIKNKYIK